MALRDLSTAKMVRISGAWLDADHEQPVLLGLRRVEPLLGDLQRVHTGLLQSQRKTDQGSAELKRLGAKAAELDAVHDRRARGIYDGLGALANLVDDPERAKAARTAQAELFPDGLTITTRSYSDEAGEAELVGGRMSPATKALLKAESLGGVSFATHVTRWRSAARELGAVEQERTVLQAELKAEPRGTTAARARNAWIKIMTVILSALELEDLSDETRRKLLRPLLVEQEKSASRGRAVDEVDDEAEAGETVGGAEPPAPADPKPAKKREPVE